jgi:hypothetical protein
MQKGPKRPRGFLINHLQRGIKTNARSQQQLIVKLVRKEKKKFTIPGAPGSKWYIQ